MRWKNHLKEKLVDAARRLIDNLPTAARFAGYGPIVYAGLGDIAKGLSDNMAGLYLVGGAVGAALVGIGALIRFLPGTSADLRQTAMKMMEGGVILLAIIGTGALILQGAFGIGKSIAEAFKAPAGNEPSQYFNPWSR
jgi:hypothetical protein